jgi:hypothetical protein
VLGTHQLNCKKWAGRSSAKGHDFVVKAVAYEAKRLGLGALDKDAILKRDRSHLTSKSRCYLALSTNGQLKITNAVDRRHRPPRSELMMAVKIVAVMSSEGDRHARWNNDKTKLLNPAMKQAENTKFAKHEANYSAISGLLPCALWTLWPFLRLGKMMLLVPKVVWIRLILWIALNFGPAQAQLLSPKLHMHCCCTG